MREILYSQVFPLITPCKLGDGTTLPHSPSAASISYFLPVLLMWGGRWCRLRLSFLLLRGLSGWVLTAQGSGGITPRTSPSSPMSKQDSPISGQRWIRSSLLIAASVSPTHGRKRFAALQPRCVPVDRKSTRLNSSHLVIS